MTAEDKKLVKKQIEETIAGIKDDFLKAIRREIHMATGVRYGAWKCENCGNEKEPVYHNPRNVRIPACPVCGQAMTFLSQ